MIAPALSVRQFYDDYYKPLRLRSRSDNTRRLYEYSIRNFGTFLHRDATLADFNDDTVGRLMYWMTEKGRSPYTVNKERSQLLAIWRFACRKGYLSEWPDVDPENAPERIPRAWTSEQLDRLFQACLATPGAFSGVPCGLWWYALHLLAWDTGERIKPLRCARWEWLDLDGRLFRVPAEYRKGRRADRCYQLHPETVEALGRILACQRTKFGVTTPAEVFPFPYSLTYLYNLYATLLKRAGLPAGREFKFHCLRRSVASHGKAAGLDPQELMGHRDSKTTAKYLDPTVCGGKSASEVLRRPVVTAALQTRQMRLF